MSVKKTHLVLIISAIVLFVLLFIAPKIAPKHTDGDGHDHSAENKAVSTNATLDVYLNLALNSLDPEKKKQSDKFIAAMQLDSVVVFWDKLKRPDLAAFYTEELAKKESKVANWLKAGNRYYYAIQFIQDKTAIPVLYQSASRCFAKGLELEPNNVDAKIMLASCYVEGSEDPMEGIKRLKEIEKTDSNNVKLQLTFAFFALGHTLTLLGFIALAVGGLGSNIGALIGGAALGLLNSFASYYFGGEYQQTIAVGLLMVVLLIKPEGLLGAKNVRPV